MKALALFVLLATAFPAQAQQPAMITTESLLDEMVNLDSVARWPQSPFTLRQASSYDRSRVAPDKPGWFGNNDGSHYLRIEENQGRRELVMMDADGPGAVVRFHFTNGGSLNAVLRLYLDGATEPTLQWPTADLMDNELKLGNPLVARQPPPEGHGAATLYLPIPYARHCKITLEEKDAGGRYYHIDYRTYAPGTAVKTFDLETLKSLQPKMARVNQLLWRPPTPAIKQAVELKSDLKAGSEVTLDLPPGPAAVRQLELSVGEGLSPALHEQALRSVVIRANFDDEEDAIWCPVGDFMGSGAGGRPLSSWYRDFSTKGLSTSRWTMPYRRNAHFTLCNFGQQTVQVRLKAGIGSWKWDENSLIFHCNWHQQVGIPSEPPRDWNFLTAHGRGVLVGDVMSVYNPLPSWYGEGNEKIWVDGESFPSHIGTGSEDYYNASWAPNPVYQTPFTNHPRMDEANSGGQNVYTRSRNLDGLPFEKSLQFDFEIMTWKESHVDYAATTYWYGAPGAKANLGAQIQEAKRPVPIWMAPMGISGALEMESLPIVGKSAGLVVEPQGMGNFQGTWSGRAQLLIRGKKVGDFVDIAIPAPSKAPRRLVLYATLANDYGILQFSVNGQKVEGTLDGYAPNPTPLVQVPLGVFTPQNGQLVLRAELVGANPASRGDRFLAALDAVKVME